MFLQNPNDFKWNLEVIRKNPLSRLRIWGRKNIPSRVTCSKQKVSKIHKKERRASNKVLLKIGTKKEFWKAREFCKGLYNSSHVSRGRYRRVNLKLRLKCLASRISLFCFLSCSSQIFLEAVRHKQKASEGLGKWHKPRWAWLSGNLNCSPR